MRARSPRPISSRKKIAPLSGNNATSHSAPGSASQVGGPLKPMSKKKRDEEQLLEAPQHVRELLRTLVVREHRAEQQCAELGAQAERLEPFAAADRERGAEQHQQLAVAAALQQPGDRRARERHEQQQQRVGRRRFEVDEREQDHGHDVLHDQDADRDAAVHGPELAIAVEHLRREHGARETED